MTPLTAVAYLRVSTREQGDSGHGLSAQETAIREAVAARGWHLASVHQDVISSRRKSRPGLEKAMQEAKETGAVLVSAKMTRLYRSTKEMLTLYDRAAQEGWYVCALDNPLADTTQQNGMWADFMRTVMAGVGQLERALISERTKEGLADARANGTRSGRPIGRPRAMPQATINRIATLRAEGLSLRKIATALNEEGIAGSQGGRWTDMTVRAALMRYGLYGVNDSRSTGSTSGDDLTRVLSAADELDRRADAIEAGHDDFLNGVARALRDSWRPEDKNYGSIAGGSIAGTGKSVASDYAFNGGNGNSWHQVEDERGKRRRRNLTQYRALYIAVALEEEDAFYAADVPQPSDELAADLHKADDMRKAAAIHRRHVAVLRGENDWAYDEDDRRLARAEVDRLLAAG